MVDKDKNIGIVETQYYTFANPPDLLELEVAGVRRLGQCDQPLVDQSLWDCGLVGARQQHRHSPANTGTSTPTATASPTAVGDRPG